jgi:hypothetical protein
LPPAVAEEDAGFVSCWIKAIGCHRRHCVLGMRDLFVSILRIS